MTQFKVMNRTVTLVLAAASLCAYATGRFQAAAIVDSVLIGWMWKANWRDDV